MTPGDRVAQLYPQALGTHFSRLYDMHGLQWDYSLIPATTRDINVFPVSKRASQISCFCGDKDVDYGRLVCEFPEHGSHTFHENISNTSPHGVTTHKPTFDKIFLHCKKIVGYAVCNNYYYENHTKQINALRGQYISY
jgi:hypothetical protein